MSSKGEIEPSLTDIFCAGVTFTAACTKAETYLFLFRIHASRQLILPIQLLALRNRPSSDILLLPEWSSRVNEKHLESPATTPEHQIITAGAAKPIPTQDYGATVYSLRPKQPRLRLDREAYEALRKEVLAKDNWRCQNCGASVNLQVHHILSRSKLRHDSADNLITVCARRHAALHGNCKELPTKEMWEVKYHWPSMKPNAK